MSKLCPKEGCTKSVEWAGLYCKTCQDNEIEYQVVNGTTFYKDKQTGDWCKLGKCLPGLQRVPLAFLAEDNPKHAMAMRNVAKLDAYIAEQLIKKNAKYADWKKNDPEAYAAYLAEQREIKSTQNTAKKEMKKAILIELTKSGGRRLYQFDHNNHFFKSFINLIHCPHRPYCRHPQNPPNTTASPPWNFPPLFSTKNQYQANRN
jgi:hypothetical protein